MLPWTGPDWPSAGWWGKARREWFYQLYQLQNCSSNHPRIRRPLQVKSNKSKFYCLNAAIVRSSKHIENSIWAEKLAGGSADLKNTLGWGGLAGGEEAIVPPGSTWQHGLRPSKEPGSLRTLDSVIGQVREHTIKSNQSNIINLNFRVKGSRGLAGQTLLRLRKQATIWKMRYHNKWILICYLYIWRF